MLLARRHDKHALSQQLRMKGQRLDNMKPDRPVKQPAINSPLIMFQRFFLEFFLEGVLEISKYLFLNVLKYQKHK